MFSVRHVLSIAALVSACAMVSLPAYGKTLRMQSKPSPTAGKTTPLLFYLAKGDTDACGKGCSEWVAVEGTFNQGAADRFRVFVKTLGVRKPPIIFNSPGGSVENAFAIGRLMRARGFAASVGVTLPDVCTAGESDACRTAKSSGQPVPARLIDVTGHCNSACVYALIGATARSVPPGANLGVHASRQQIMVTVRAGDAVPNERVRTYAAERFRAYEKTARTTANSRTREYIVEMGVAPELFSIANAVPHELVRYLTREEILRFGIDTRSFAESSWSLLQPPGQRPLLIKFIAESRAPGNNAVRSSMLLLTCDTGSGTTLVYGQQSESGDQPTPVVFKAGTSSFGLPNAGRNFRFGPTAQETNYLTRAARVPPDFFDAVSQAGGFNLVEDARSERTFSADQLTGALRDFRQKCEAGIPEANPAPQPVAAPQPAKVLRSNQVAPSPRYLDAGVPWGAKR